MKALGYAYTAYVPKLVIHVQRMGKGKSQTISDKVSLPPLWRTTPERKRKVRRGFSILCFCSVFVMMIVPVAWIGSVSRSLYVLKLELHD